MNKDKEEMIFKRRLLDLAFMTEKRDICTYADFLNQNEISIFHSIRNELPKVNYELFGGYDGAERKILCFYGDNSVKAFSSYIACIRILPVQKKFSDDLNHRDFLGAIMNLGIERSLIGDILVKDKEGYVFLKSSIATFIMDNLSKIKHTTIKCELVEEDAPEIKPKFETIRGTIASERLDAIIAMAFKASRSSILPLISGGKVFVDGKLIESNSYMLKEDETVSVRGYGKFIYKGLETQTKKGRYYVSLLKYV